MELAKEAIELFRVKSIDIREDTVLAFVKACLRTGNEEHALTQLGSKENRMGVWAGADSHDLLAEHYVGIGDVMKMHRVLRNMQFTGVRPSSNSARIQIRYAIGFGVTILIF
jgi:hypothetical protein